MAIELKPANKCEQEVLNSLNLDHSLENIQLVQEANREECNSYATLVAEVAKEFQGIFSEEELRIFTELMIYIRTCDQATLEKVMPAKYSELDKKGLFMDYLEFSSRVHNIYHKALHKRLTDLKVLFEQP